MALNEKIKTEDVIEILDTKIVTGQGHPALGVLPRENYDSVLTKLETQVLTPEQKAAFDATLTTPGPTNPVVLKNDLDNYIPTADLGEFRDAVFTFSALPLPISRTGNFTSGSAVVSGLSSLTGLAVGQALSATEVPSGAKVAEIYASTMSLRLTVQATVSSSGANLTTGPVDGEMRGVLNEKIIYRWDGTAWTPFISTGTLDHTELDSASMNADENFQHLTQSEKTGLLNQTHTHTNKAILDQIVSAGSGQIITDDERSRLPTSNQKLALIGTSGTPSTTNPYVTSQDPRLNTVRNPYVTVGPPGSLATFQGVDFRPFEDAVQSITVGAAAAVKAIEVLPGFYTLGGVPIVWQTQNNSLLIENFTPGTSILSFQTFAAGIQALLPGTGQLVVRGFTFELNDLGTCGVLTQRPNSIIENCIFQPGPTTSDNQVGITLEGDNSVVRRCLFKGQLAKGIVIKAKNCRVEECKFDLEEFENPGIEVDSTATYAFINHCHFINGKLIVNTNALNTQVSGNHFSAVTAITNNGFNTRILENLPQEVNQPFLGKKRTVGPTASYADFRGNDHVPFLEALADPNVSEIEVLDGTYEFSATVPVPAAKSIRGVTNGDQEVLVQGAPGVKLFTLESYSRLENLVLEGSNASLVSAENTIRSELKNCVFNLEAVDTTDDYGLSGTSVEEMQIAKCSFEGVRGLYINGSIESSIDSSIFSTSSASLFMTGSCLRDTITQNHFDFDAPTPRIQGTNSVIVGNHFTGNLPSKLFTTNSVWQANWPHHQANNETGVDNLKVSLDRYLEPVGNVCARSLISGVGTLSFAENQDSTAGTSLIKLSARLNRQLGFSANLYWTCSLTTGDVVWKVTTVFRDQVSQTIGIPVSKTVVSTRDQLTPNEEDLATFAWTNLEFGLPLGVDPTHVSVTVERVGTLNQDTLATDAHLVEIELTLPRD